MTKAFAFIGVLALLGICGCEMSSPRGGGMSASDSFRIIVPGGDMQLQQGAIQTLNVSLDRGETFKRDVKVAVRTEKGIAVEPSSFTIKASAPPEAMVRVSAAKDAPLGDYRVTLVGTPTSGEETIATLRVKVITP